MEPPPPPLLPRHFLFPLLLLLLLLPLHAAAGSPPHPASRCSDSERTALLQFKAGLGRDSDTRVSSWQGNDCCRWTGVACDNRTGAVVKLDLRNPNSSQFLEDFNRNLSGRLDSSLLRLHSLAFLDLSGNRFDGNPIPPWLGSLTQLKHLDLSCAGFAGVVPPQLGNLSSLQYLDVSPHQDQLLRVDDNLHWISRLSSLRFLSLDGVDLSRVNSAEFIHLLNTNLASLAELHLADCGLTGIPHSLPAVNFTSLAVVDLSRNTFASSTFPTWLLNITTLSSLSMTLCGLHGNIPPALSDLPNLQTLGLSLNNISGTIPSSMGKLCNLRFLHLDSNSITGTIPSSMGKLCNLRLLYLNSNNLTGELPQTLEQSDACGPGPLSSLVELDLSDNTLSENLPAWLGELKNIKCLVLQSNMFTGSLPLSLGNLSELVIFSVWDNQLAGAVSEAHFSGLKNLQDFSVGANPGLAADVSSDWTPPFQVRRLDLGNFHLGPKFPAWIKNQKQLEELDLSNAGISDTIPTWFWGLSPELQELNLSSNCISGDLPESSISGMKGLTSLDLSNNRFTGSIPSALFTSTAKIRFLDLSNNNFSGRVPGGGAGLKGAFNISTFHGNPYLCGPPTSADCVGDYYSQSGHAGEERPSGGLRYAALIGFLHFLLGVVAIGLVAVLLLRLAFSKCRGLLRKRGAEAKATPTSAAAGPAIEQAIK